MMVFVLQYCAEEPDRWWEINQRRISFDPDEDSYNYSEGWYVPLRIKRKL